MLEESRHEKYCILSFEKEIRIVWARSKIIKHLYVVRLAIA